MKNMFRKLPIYLNIDFSVQQLDLFSCLFCTGELSQKQKGYKAEEFIQFGYFFLNIKQKRNCEGAEDIYIFISWGFFVLHFLCFKVLANF